VQTTDTVGRPVDVTVGITRNPDGGHLVPAVAIDDGPTAVLPDIKLGAVVANLRQALTDVLDSDRRGGA
jgi:hypothetical protein